MAGINIVDDFLSSVTGNIEPAYLEVQDTRKLKRASGGKSLAEKTSQALADGLDKRAVQAVSGPGKMFRVQFNPNELQLYATTYPVNRTDAQKQSDSKRTISDSSLKPTVEMTATLYFDQVNIYDAFMFDKVTMGASASSITNIAAAIAEAAGKKWSVQPQVEGFIAALRNSYTRSICFRWADFEFTGLLRNVSARYTMFSVSGRPVRAQVTIRLRQELDPDLLNGWYRDFKEAFQGDSTNLATPGQYAGSLIGGI